MNVVPIIINAVQVFAGVLNVLIFVRILLSWLPVRKDSQLIQLVYALTEPILSPIRNLLNKSPFGGPGMMLDFSPIIAYILIELVSNVIISIVRTL